MRKQATNTELLKLRDDLRDIEYPEVKKGTIWKDDKRGVEYVIVDKVKTGSIFVKRHMDAADSSSMTPAAFHRKYKPCEGKEGRIQVRYRE